MESAFWVTIKKVKDKIELWFAKNDVKEENTIKKLLLVLEDKKTAVALFLQPF